MTVAQLLEELVKMPEGSRRADGECGGLSRVSALDFVDGRGPGAPAEVILLPNMDE
jgi:hypothetical protein